MAFEMGSEEEPAAGIADALLTFFILPALIKMHGRRRDTGA